MREDEQDIKDVEDSNKNEDTRTRIKSTTITRRRGESYSKPEDEANEIFNVQSSFSDSSLFNLDLVGSRICQIIIPVTLCSIYVLILIRILEWNVYYSRGGFIERAWIKLGLDYEESTFSISNLVNNIIVVSIFILIIVIVSLIMLFVLYMGWHNWLSYYFYLPSLILMSILTPVYIKEVLNAQDCLSLDIITLFIFNWNFTILGLISIFNFLNISGPLCLQQFYLIHNSTLLAVVILSSLPSWTPWLLLGILVFWDLFAVLAPYGPLNLIINMAEKVGVLEMPGLVYTTNSKHLDSDKSKDEAETVIIDGGEKSKEEVATHESGKVEGPQQESNGIQSVSRKKSLEEHGVNIGLGDFIFYSLLIGLTAKGRDLNDFFTTIATFNAILVGLVLTLGILALTKRPLPALPISIGLGLVTSVLTMYSAPQFMNKLSSAQIFI